MALWPPWEIFIGVKITERMVFLEEGGMRVVLIFGNVIDGTIGLWLFQGKAILFARYKMPV